MHFISKKINETLITIFVKEVIKILLLKYINTKRYIIFLKMYNLRDTVVCIFDFYFEIILHA